jgi:predicted transposase/invertase (TIGR01784 family)
MSLDHESVDSPPGNEIHHPHDKLFKQLLGERENAVSFLEHYLPAELLQHMDLNSLEVTQVSFVDSQFVQSEADLLITLPLEGRAGYVYVLFEHQSSPDAGMLLRLLSYMVRIWKRFSREHSSSGPLPVIVPLVLFHGSKAWQGPLDFQSLVDIPSEAFAPFTPHFRCRMFDFSALSPEAIAGNAVVRILLNLLASTGQADSMPHVTRAFETLKEIFHARGFARLLEIILRYVLHVHDMPPSELQKLAGNAIDPSVKEEIMTTYEQLIQKGKEIGIQQGEAIGIRKGEGIGVWKVLQRLLRKRFPLDAEQLVPLLGRLSLSQQEELTEKILDVTDADEIRQWIQGNS